MSTHCQTCQCDGGRVLYLYKIWDNIKYRTTNPNSKDYHRYGGRGIHLHKSWEDYMTFQNYVLETIGPRPTGHSFDRIDNDRGYEPGNVRWATATIQIRNRS